ncbi:SpoVR family protein [Candidatus Chromulinivorax destructor]|uniref:Uncharacterized protein n=1 Tax=Candidatus Chromulinivorax destructor TaxID=2066483 RepID=A0A345ZB72_9BACT|nr:SpoVR family protein [Candidatus Chromulinivorax destructor]AXK60539.1 hypothetical protein C0J27_02150 [Candidatus Chromulinivorax destructor]
MKFNTTISFCALLLTSSIMSAGPMNKFVTAGLAAFIHQNIMTKQDLTKIPTITQEDVTEYYNKFTTTILHTKKSLEPIFAGMQQAINDAIAEVEANKKKELEEEAKRSKK